MFDFLKRNRPNFYPIIDDNTFLLWEPCSQNHAEVVPGFAQYLLDLGYRVSVLITPERITEGLFSLFGEDDRLYLSLMTQQQIRRFLLKNGIGQARGILISTITDKIDIRKIPLKPGQRCLCVSHDVKDDVAAIDETTITLRRVDYNGRQTVVVNPHYFGNIPLRPKNEVVNFITVGALRDKRRNLAPLVDAVQKLRSAGWRNFKITIVGKGGHEGEGGLGDLNEDLQHSFNVCGRVDFRKMYEEIQKADFFMPLLDENNPDHERYITTGTSGSFQLIYGFLKPPLIARKFAPINGFDSRNCIIHENSSELAAAMEQALRMKSEDYDMMRKELGKYAHGIYRESLGNLRNLIERPEADEQETAGN